MDLLGDVKCVKFNTNFLTVYTGWAILIFSLITWKGSIFPNTRKESCKILGKRRS